MTGTLSLLCPFLLEIVPLQRYNPSMSSDRTLKDHIIEKKGSIKRCSKDTKIPYSTLNDLCNGKTDIRRMQLGTVLRLAEKLGLSADDLVSICEKSKTEALQDNVFVKNKGYYLHLENRDYYVCKVNALNTEYLPVFVKWIREDISEKKEGEKWLSSI